MGVNVREKSIDEFEEKLSTIATALSKITYLESALRESGFSFEIKRYLLGNLAILYEERKMYDKAAKAMEKKAGIEITSKDKIDSYIMAARLYCEAGKVDAAEDMFFRASRDSSMEDKNKIRLASKNLFQVQASELEKKGKKAAAVKFYEKLIKMNLDEGEKKIIKEKMRNTYNALGLFREARMLE